MSTLCREDILDVDLLNGSVPRSFVCKLLSEGDSNSIRFGFRCFKGDQQISLINESTTVIGYFMRADGATVVIQGERTREVGYVELPPSCFSVIGNFTLVIKITSPNFIGTMRIIDGTVTNSTNLPIVDPGSIIPDVEELLDVVDQIRAAAEAIDDFSISSSLIEGTRYRLISATT